VIDPCRNETWSAVAGRGAWLNGSPIQVAEGRSDISRALVATGFSYNLERRVWQSATSSLVIPRVRDVRRFGSAALDLCWVGGGRFDCYYEWDLKPWDMCAGALVCREAGGRVEALPEDLVVAGTKALFPELVELVAWARSSADEDSRHVVQ
ncbi:MAG: inositol monophosphatase family protein, partial [Acidimicrobiales bacterium]